MKLISAVYNSIGATETTRIENSFFIVQKFNANSIA